MSFTKWNRSKKNQTQVLDTLNKNKIRPIHHRQYLSQERTTAPCCSRAPVPTGFRRRATCRGDSSSALAPRPSRRWRPRRRRRCCRTERPRCSSPPAPTPSCAPSTCSPSGGSSRRSRPSLISPNISSCLQQSFSSVCRAWRGNVVLCGDVVSFHIY